MVNEASKEIQAYLKAPPLTEPCTLKVLGWALYRTKVFGPPKYYIGMENGRRIFDIAYKDDEVLTLCQKLQRVKHMSAEDAKRNVGFGMFLNGAGLRFFQALTPLKTQQIKLKNWYDMPYQP